MLGPFLLCYLFSLYPVHSYSFIIFIFCALFDVFFFFFWVPIKGDGQIDFFSIQSFNTRYKNKTTSKLFVFNSFKSKDFGKLMKITITSLLVCSLRFMVP